MTSAGVVLAMAGLDTLQALLNLAAFLPMLAVAWRRMHDADSSGALVLLPIATMIAAVYIQLFAMLGPLKERMAGLTITPDTTLREMQQQLDSANLDVALNGAPVISVFAILVGCAGGLWLIYLLARPTLPGPNRFGPNPLEATP